jgi:TolB-like protein
VAVIPFLDLSGRRRAGTITALHFVKQLIRSAQFTVVDPGLVREQLLKYRIIMESGPSFANSEIISSDVSLGVDLVFSGTVFDYQDVFGIPKVEFSVKIIEGRSRQLVWSSRSQNDGKEGVVFFDLGRIYTTHQLASDMAWGTFEALTR